MSSNYVPGDTLVDAHWKQRAQKAEAALDGYKTMIVREQDYSNNQRGEIDDLRAQLAAGGARGEVDPGQAGREQVDEDAFIWSVTSAVRGGLAELTLRRCFMPTCRTSATPPWPG